MKTKTPVLLLAVLLLLPWIAAFPGALSAAATCDRSGCGRALCASPATPAPSDRWGGLKPLGSYTTCTSTGPAFCTDSTAFVESQQAYSSFPWYMSLDTENNYLFVALAHGLQVWDARNGFPQPLSQLSFRAFPVWSANAELKWPLQDVDAPANVDDEVAVAGLGGIGIGIIDLSDKTSPKVLYQSYKKDGTQVYTATLGARRYAFLATATGDPAGGLFAFDMTQAKIYTSAPCFEAVPAGGEAVQCPGVYLGRIGSRTSVSYVDGVDQFVVASAGTSRGFEIWDLSNPASPLLKLTGLNDRTANGVALWKQGSAYYLAVRTVAFEPTAGREVHRTSIYDVSCVAGSSCPALGAPLFSAEFNGGGISEFVDFSRSNGVPFLYLGSDERCLGGTQREWLLDVSNPAAAQDISPFNYWGWYYRGGPTGFNLVAPRSGKFVGNTFYRAGLSIFDYHQRTGTTGGGGSSIDLAGPDSGQTGGLYTFTATATGCTPSDSGWTWGVGDGVIAGSATGPQVAVSWSNPGTKPISATNSACGSALGLKPVAISGTGSLAASFTFSPSSPKPGQAITFDASSSAGGPTQYTWDFGDGTTAVGKVVTHAYPNAGGYSVQLTISRPGASDRTQRVVAVAADVPPPPDATFQTSATCSNQFGFDVCQATAGTAVSFTANATGAASYAWDFGDGTATGRAVTHTWSQAGSYAVTLTVSNSQASASSSETFQIGSAGPGPGPGPGPEPVHPELIPWIAETSGALVQSTGLYVYNPGVSPITVTIEFRKRGTPDVNPPRATRTIAPGATLFFADVLKDLFARQNTTGFLTVTPQGTIDVAPVVTSFNTTLQGSSRFGQTVPGQTLGGGTLPAVQDLVALSDDGEKLSYFGVTNPNPAPATYRLRFFDATGKQIALSPTFTVSAFGQRQFQEEEIHGTFGVSGADYRVQVETLSGGALYPYGSVIRRATGDPSFIEPGVAKSSRSYLVGALSAPGPMGSLFRTDAVLANLGAQPLHADLSFLSVGPGARSTAPVSLTLQPGETRRLTDVIHGQWGVANAIGILTLVSRDPSGALPVFQGESYDDAQPSRRFGQSMTAFSDADAATAGRTVVLTGLRQDADYRTTLWLFNPATEAGLYDLVYRGLDGTVLGRLDGIALGAGKARQLSPGQHPIPAAGAPGGFTVQVVVHSGKLLAAGQVVNNGTNDPAYVQGASR